MNNDQEAQPVILIIRHGNHISWIQINQSERTILVRNNKIARCSVENKITDGKNDIVDYEILIKHEIEE